MKNYLIVDTWNGQGYSDSKAYIRLFRDDDEAMHHAYEEAKKCMPDGLVTPMEQNGHKYIQYEPLPSDNETNDAGAIHYEVFDPNTFGVAIMPMINDYSVFTSRKDWKAELDRVREWSEDYDEDEQNLFSVIHHDVTGDDILLFPVGRMHEVESHLSDANWECVGGDGVEFEDWSQGNSETTYRVPIEIVRDWDEMEPY